MNSELGGSVIREDPGLIGSLGVIVVMATLIDSKKLVSIVSSPHLGRMIMFGQCPLCGHILLQGGCEWKVGRCCGRAAVFREARLSPLLGWTLLTL